MTIKCAVIEDLLPSYIDGLTSDESNQLIKEHLKDCTNCSKIYHEMKQELPNISQSIDTPSDYNERKLVQRIKSKIMTVIVTLVITFSLLGFLVGSFGNILFQEGNPIPILSSIIKLEFTDVEYVELSTVPERYISEIELGNNDWYSVVKEFMETRGWEYKEQIGSGLIFEKDKDQIIVSTRQYTKNYFIWSLPEKETLEN